MDLAFEIVVIILYIKEFYGNNHINPKMIKNCLRENVELT